MLAEMRIQGLGIIDDAQLELHPRFTVITGETGAGKTMVVSGLHLLSGGRSDTSRVRSSAKKTVVEGRFELANHPQAVAIVEEGGGEADEDGSVIVVRTVDTDGRSRTHLGGHSVPVGALSQLSELLIAVHGQNNQLRLLLPGQQRAVLDSFAGDAVGEPLTEYRRVRAEWQSLASELKERTTKSHELAQQANMLQHGLEEIAAVAPLPGEDTALAEQIKRLAEADVLRAAASAAQLAISGTEDGDPDQPGALGLLGDARRRLATVEDRLLANLEPRLLQASALLSDVGDELGRYLNALDADPLRLEQCLSRQSELKRLIRKYAVDVKGVLAWAEDARARLSTMDISEEVLTEFGKRRDVLANELVSHAIQVSKARKVAAAELSEAIAAELAALAMTHATFDVAITQRPADATDPVALDVNGVLLHAGKDGVDKIQLQLRPHKGAPALPVHKGASGGELSRVMLAIEVVLANADPVPTLVFDELDSGVGGRAGVELGRRLARLARTHQVVVVTHLPQVAAYADRQLVVNKGTAKGITRSDIRMVGNDERVAELARMLAGMGHTKTGRAHAEELLATAEAEKVG
jgi:DNA repair protein RecN (Recombination protein N)